MRQPSRVKVRSLNRIPPAAFTLVEMLVACAVAMLLLVSLAGIVSQSMDVSRRANNTLLAYNEAAAAIDLLANDLESLAVTRQPFEYLQMTTETVEAAAGVSRLLFLSVATQDNTADADMGQLRAISYRLLRQDPISSGGKNPVYGLYRSSVSASDTFQKFSGQTDLASSFNSVTPSLDDFVAGNIVDFRVRFYPAGSQTPANTSGGAVQPVRISGNSTKVNGSDYSGILAWAEVTMTVLENSGVKLLDAGTIDLETARQRYGRILTRRVALRQPH